MLFLMWKIPIVNRSYRVYAKALYMVYELGNTMDIRSIQRTGDMRYVYLPTKWCKEHKIGAGSKVMLEEKDDGSLVVLPELREKKLKRLVLNTDEEDFDIIQKLIVSCYINPAESFKINLKKTIDPVKLLNNKGLTSLELVEIDKNQVICDSALAVSDPESLLRTSIRKIKNMLVVMMKNYHAELIARYEDEIDRNKLLINKAVVSALTYNIPSKLKTIDLYYIGLVSTYLERMVDHLIGLKKTERQFLEHVFKAVDKLQHIFENLEQLDYHKAIEFLRVLRKMKDIEIKDVGTYQKRRIKKYLINVGEVLLDWAITNELEK